jgi:hypothetical protein
MESTGLTVSINQQGENEAAVAQGRERQKTPTSEGGRHNSMRNPRNEGGLTGAGARNSIVGS